MRWTSPRVVRVRTRHGCRPQLQPPALDRFGHTGVGRKVEQRVADEAVAPVEPDRRVGSTAAVPGVGVAVDQGVGDATVFDPSQPLG